MIKANNLLRLVLMSEASKQPTELEHTIPPFASCRAGGLLGFHAHQRANISAARCLVACCKGGSLRPLAARFPLWDCVCACVCVKNDA